MAKIIWSPKTGINPYDVVENLKKVARNLWSLKTVRLGSQGSEWSLNALYTVTGDAYIC